EVLLRYGPSNGWLDGRPAVVTRVVGAGRITYVGAWLEAVVMGKLASWLVQMSGVEIPFAPVPEGVEVCRRAGPRGDTFIVVNHTPRPQMVELQDTFQDVLGGATHHGELKLAPRDVVVLMRRA
ncbi:MAG TPA: Beta-galactosidase C-terminal domain, partial [Herpetosiphonaceae bacterium]|nr:Beta-galactosidase C-terminal domain [Herpetosiphonaceae bacterium]